MNKETSSITLSDIDEQRFGIKTAKALGFRSDDIANALRFCRQNDVVFLIARCLTSDLNLAQDLERTGFLLMDTLLYYSCDLKKVFLTENIPGIKIRPLRNGEEEIIKTIASDTFKGYLGHYHADRRLDRERCDEVYIDWAYQSCISKNMADIVLVAEQEESIVGFATIKVKSPGVGEGVLFGVAPSAQGKGIYRLLMIQGMRWCIGQGHETMVVSTQISNVAVQKVWCRLGFEPNYAYYTFHKWFDDVGK
jgi:GNAT superfamily N-acetyltransferase